MPLSAIWKMICDGCGFTQTTEVELTKETMEPRWFDIWGPGTADILQRTRKDDIPLFFHDKECYKAWLLKNEGQAAVEEFEHGVWTA